MIELTWIFIKTYFKEIIMGVLFSYGTYWHIKALEYQNIISTMNQNAKIIEASLDQSIREEDEKKVENALILKRIQNTQVSNNCQDSLNWVFSKLNSK